MKNLIVLIIVLLSVASTPLTLKKLIDRPKYSENNSEAEDKTDRS